MPAKVTELTINKAIKNKAIKMTLMAASPIIGLLLCLIFITIHLPFSYLYFSVRTGPLPELLLKKDQGILTAQYRLLKTRSWP
jgi:hypothetical protein